MNGFINRLSSEASNQLSGRPAVEFDSSARHHTKEIWESSGLLLDSVIGLIIGIASLTSAIACLACMLFQWLAEFILGSFIRSLKCHAARKVILGVSTGLSVALHLAIFAAMIHSQRFGLASIFLFSGAILTCAIFSVRTTCDK